MFDLRIGNYTYIRTSQDNDYRIDFCQADQTDTDDQVKSSDHTLHESIDKIFHERCLGSNDRIKEFLRKSQHYTDQNPIIKSILQIMPNEDLKKLSLLWISVLAGYEKSAELLVRSGADVNELFGRHDPQIIDEKWTVLHVLLQMDPSPENERLIYVVIDHGADLQARDCSGQTVLYYAIKQGRELMTKMLLEKGADVNAADDKGMTPLLVAVSKSQVDEMVPLLMQHGADVQARDHKRKTALHYAVREGRIQMTETLLENGADVNAVDDVGMTPLLFAASNSKVNELVPLLLKHRAYVLAKNVFGENALHRLTYVDPQIHTAEVARVFIEKGVSVDDGKTEFMQPIHVAVNRRNNELVNLFLDYGANVNALSFCGISPLFLAVSCENNAAVVETLLKRGANVNQTCIFDGSTALNVACDVSREEYTKLLLSYGVDVLIENILTGKTALATILSSENGENLSCVRAIIEVLVLKKVCQPTIELKDEIIIKNYPMLWQHYRDSIEQTEQRMKSTAFIETCTFYELLTKCQCQIATLMRNPTFEIEFKLYDLNDFSTYYAEVITRAFERAQNYYHSMLEQEEVISEAFYQSLPYVVVKRVAHYILCNCYENVK